MTLTAYPTLRLRLTPTPALKLRFIPALPGVLSQGQINAINTALASKVNRAGDTMSGALTLAANPTVALDAATKQYVDAAIGGGGVTDAQYLVGATHASLTAERVVTDTASITWDLSTPGQAKANAAAGGGNVFSSGTITTGYLGRWISPNLLEAVQTISLAQMPQGTNGQIIVGLTGFPPAYRTMAGDAALASSGNIIIANDAVSYAKIQNVTAASKLLGRGGAVGAGDVEEITLGSGLTMTGTTLAASAAVTVPAPQHGRLTYVSATQLKFAPFDGDKIKINGVIYDIPGAGITTGLTNASLGANTTYYVYCLVSGGVPIGSLQTSAHSMSTTAGNVGVEIATGNDGLTLIGMVRTTAGAQFQDTATNRGVISWFNRRNIPLNGPTTAGAATSSTSIVELASGSRINFITWGEEAVNIGYLGSSTTATAGATCFPGLGLDGTNFSGFSGASQNATVPIASGWVSYGGFTSLPLAEGFHFLTPTMQLPVATATFTNYVYANASIRG